MKTLQTSLLLAVAALAACQTAAPASAVKTKDGQTYVLVGHDERAATPRPYTKSYLKDLSKKVAGRSKNGDTTDAKTQVTLAEIALTDGDLNAAREYAKKALAVDFRDREAKIVVAHVAFLERRFDEAQALLEQLGGAKAKESEVLTLLGCVAFATGKSRDAETHFERAVSVSSDDVAARMNLGILYLMRENEAGAATQFKEVLSRVPGNVDARIHLGIALARQGKLADALSEYKEAIKAGAGKNPVLLYDKAIAEKRAGKFDDAVKTTKSLLELKNLTVSEQEQVLALLDDIRMEKEVKGQGDKGQIEELIAAAREKVKSGAAAGNGPGDDDPLAH